MVVEAKVCGLTRPEDAVAAARHGASYLGVIFAGGPRTVTTEQAKRVVDTVGGTTVFGVFGAQSVEEILRMRDVAGLAGAQLHGAYGAKDAGRLRSEGMLVWRVARLGSVGDVDRLDELRDAADAVLVEPRVEHVLGGAGVVLDLRLALEARNRLAGVPMVLAGGLTAETVVGAAALVRPQVVDVSSGVEISPGIKDRTKLVRFLEAVVGHCADA